MRKTGKAWLSGRPTWHATVAQNADMIPGEVHTTFRDQIEQKVPWATTTRRIEFYLDHPWFIEADEHLVRYKQPPNIGGAQPLRLTSGHLRWSVHANWSVSKLDAVRRLAAGSAQGSPFCGRLPALRVHALELVAVTVGSPDQHPVRESRHRRMSAQ
jgi:hypothetical protein